MGLNVDRAALRVNHAGVVFLTLLGFLADQPYAVFAAALATALGALAPDFAPFRLLYVKLLRPAGIVKPAMSEGDALPHHFTQGLGSGLLLLALTALTNGDGLLGWGLTLTVTALAALNLVFGWCAGCFLYHQLGRLGVIPTNAPPHRRE